MEIRSAEMRAKILEGAGADALMELAVSEGMIPLREAALMAVADGETSIAEAMKIILGGRSWLSGTPHCSQRSVIVPNAWE